jgi:hypothetical protein
MLSPAWAGLRHDKVTEVSPASTATRFDGWEGTPGKIRTLAVHNKWSTKKEFDTSNKRFGTLHLYIGVQRFYDRV